MGGWALGVDRNPVTLVLWDDNRSVSTDNEHASTCPCWLRRWISLPMQKLQELWFWSLGWLDTLAKETATHSGILAWRIPWTEEPGGLQSTGSQRVAHDWETNSTLVPHGAQPPSSKYGAGRESSLTGQPHVTDCREAPRKWQEGLLTTQTAELAHLRSIPAVPPESYGILGELPHLSLAQFPYL